MQAVIFDWFTDLVCESPRLNCLLILHSLHSTMSLWSWQKSAGIAALQTNAFSLYSSFLICPYLNSQKHTHISGVCVWFFNICCHPCRLPLYCPAGHQEWWGTHTKPLWASWCLHPGFPSQFLGHREHTQVRTNACYCDLRAYKGKFHCLENSTFKRNTRIKALCVWPLPSPKCTQVRDFLLKVSKAEYTEPKWLWDRELWISRGRDTGGITLLNMITGLGTENT